MTHLKLFAALAVRTLYDLSNNSNLWSRLYRMYVRLNWYCSYMNEEVAASFVALLPAKCLLALGDYFSLRGWRRPDRVADQGDR